DEHRRRLGILKVNFRLRSACTMFEIYHAAHDEHRRRLGILKVNFRLRSACTMFEIYHAAHDELCE
ncbi:MAG: hypothetical protein IKH02_08060, partial [Prevotella sp.]|nr:hypothetical protein [Prevotella sp.]